MKRLLPIPCSFALFLFPFLFLQPHGVCAGEQPINIIPQPAQISHREGVFQFQPSTQVVIKTSDTVFTKLSNNFLDELRKATTFKLMVADSVTDTTITSLTITQSAGMVKEGYRLDIAPARILISASDPAGLFYAFQSMKQLLPNAFFDKKNKKKNTKWQMPCAGITDYPRFAYRGMHLDVSRHFFSIDFLKKYLDILAFYKINTFHWHLTDSQGWRIEIKQYPRLTSVGAWRADRRGIPMSIALPTQEGEKRNVGGFYTQEDVRDLVNYARERFITIIPEIEMPGHATAALVAYPEYTCLNNPVPLRMPCGHPGDAQHNFCPGNDSTFLFLQNVLTEVMELFPSEYIHIGGDEVNPESWLRCPRCQKRMQQEKLSTATQLQHYFTGRIAEYLAINHRRMIGWDEIVQGGLPDSAAVMSWRGMQAGVLAAKDSHEVIMSPYSFVYFDFYQSAPRLEPDISYAGLFLNKVYAFDPVPDTLDAKQAAHIRGGEGCLWTENISTNKRVEYMLLPRLMALSESLWTPPANKNYQEFVGRVEKHFAMLDLRGISYARSLYNISIDPAPDTAGVLVSLSSQTGSKHLIRYNLSGGPLSASDPIYTGPVHVDSSTVIKTGLFMQDTLLGKVNEEKFSIHQALHARVSIQQAGSDTSLTHALSRLTDGIHGTIEPDDGRWVVFRDSVFSIQLDLGRTRSLSRLRFRCLDDFAENIFVPGETRVSVSADGRHYEPLELLVPEIDPDQQLREVIEYRAMPFTSDARYIRLDVQASGRQNPYRRGRQSILLDEIVAE